MEISFYIQFHALKFSGFRQMPYFFSVLIAMVVLFLLIDDTFFISNGKTR